MKIKLLPLTLALGFSVASVQAIAWEGDIKHENNKAYVQDKDGDTVRDSWGRCVRTNNWTKETATAKCEGWPEPVVAAPVAAEPVAEAAPVAQPAPVVVAEVAPVVAVPLSFNAFFENDGQKLTSRAKENLDEYAEYMKAHPTSKVNVTGYADSKGKPAYNQKLSEKRAEAAKSYLVSKDINANRINAKGMGEKNPIADNAFADGRAQNRRVELTITQ